MAATTTRVAGKSDIPDLIELKTALTVDLTACGKQLSTPSTDWYEDFFRSLIDWPRALVLIADDEHQAAVGLGIARVLDHKGSPPFYGQLDDIYFQSDYNTATNHQRMVEALLPFFDDFEVQSVIYYADVNDQRQNESVRAAGFQAESTVYKLETKSTN